MKIICHVSWRGEGWWNVNSVRGTESSLKSAFPRFARLRRGVMLLVFALLVMQYFGSSILVGSLTASVFLGTIKLLDVFAFVETQLAARSLTLTAVLAVTPVALLYLVFGRAFCGWVCPMDFLFSLVSRHQRKETGMPLRLGYYLAGALLFIALVGGFPLFSQYLSHFTNLFRALGAAFAPEMGAATVQVALVSAAVLMALLVLEFFFPRLWCRIFCPVGKTYGLFNRISLLRLHFSQRQCSGCRRCEEVCYMGIPIMDRECDSAIRHPNCIYCGRCQDVCANQANAVRMRFARPFALNRKKGEI